MEAGAEDLAGLFPVALRLRLFYFPATGARRSSRPVREITKTAGFLLWILSMQRRVFCSRMRIRHGWAVPAAAKAGSVTTAPFTLRRSAMDLTICTRFL